ncbi:ATP-dependent RNA helicase HrpA [Actinoalloteichus caeruleus]|uniref:ATP-dependent RNA helicase HrpA n=1 Tax=Actinoalloteichus cyanogriseus TaxID=2893586 RepID=UPI003AACC697
MGTPPVTSTAEIAARLPELTLRDEQRLARRLEGSRKARGGPARERALSRITADLAAAETRVARRRAATPVIRYPDALPVSRKKDDILAAVRDHQVVIVAGETGSGKTTQLPKICLELGRGVRGAIGHTQPRRLAARTVAERVAEELATPLGETVGFKVRFTDRSTDDTLLKIMTDGILLAEIQQDRMLWQYDTIIIDEAHERSLNIDFLLGYLKQLLPRRPDLKLIITSATIDPERFSRHFDGAPIIEVSGRTYPVEVRYRPLLDEDDPDPDRDQTQAIRDAVDELSQEGPGDILVFLSGEREIRDAADALEKANLRNTEILPLYARLSAAEQHRVFSPHPGRRVVLATNVAETSLTVPGIRYVVDTGNARISRYSHRLKVQRLPIEPVSQASANQRKGRCGRVAEGICVRLYSEEDFDNRPEFTDPEILRTNLASVILQMTALELGDIAAFPFVEPPDARNIRDGVQLLHELGALEVDEDGGRRLTRLGRKLAQLPVDPRLGRMVLEAERNGCVQEVLVIAAALSIQDPRERPAERQQAASEKHARFADQESDFLSYLNLWDYLREQQRELTSNRFRRLCRNEFLNYLRVREWQDVHSQLRQIAKQLDLPMSTAREEPQRVHLALLAGLLSHVGLKEGPKQDYQGARNARFAVFPGSALFKKQPRWVMAAELVETTRLWARVVARIEPEWVERLAGHLVKRFHSEPHWEKRRGAVMALERVTLYGIPLVTGRKVNYGRIDPEVSRELFIRHALVEGDWETRHRFFHENRRLLAEVEELEHRARRRDIVVDDETLFEFYDARVGAEVVSARHFDTWWKKTRTTQPDLLTFDRSMLVNENSGGVSQSDYPDTWRQPGLEMPLSYHFEPGTTSDGITVDVPLAALNQVTPEQFTWQVPGLRSELVTALIRTLPKNVRRNFVPVPDVARTVLSRISPDSELALLPALERELHRLTGVSVPRDAWRTDQLPDHLRVTFRVVDGDGGTVAEGRDLGAIKARLRGRVRATLSHAARSLERTGLTSWNDLGELPTEYRQDQDGLTVTAYPALVDEGDTVSVRMFETPGEARRAMWRGFRRLVLLNVPSPLRSLKNSLSNARKLALTRNPHGGLPALLDDCVDCAADSILVGAGAPGRDPAAFDRLREKLRSELPARVHTVVRHVSDTLAAATSVERALAASTAPALAAGREDVRRQLAELVYPGFVTATGAARIAQLPRYLQAMERRLEKLPENPARDAQLTDQVAAVREAYDDARQRLAGSATSARELRKIRWMIEELRVSYFAQSLGTAHSVSDVRVLRAIADVEDARR